MERPNIERPRSRHRRARRIRIVLAALVLAGAPGAAPGAWLAAGAVPNPTVVVIYGTHRGASQYERFHAGLLGALNGGPSPSVQVRAEYLDILDGREPEYDAAVMQYLRQKYARDNVAVVVGVAAAATRMAVRVRHDLFPKAALVYAFVDHAVARTIDVGDNSTGVTGQLDIKRTAELALRLVPATRRIAFVLGSSDLERAWEGRIREEVRAAGPEVELIPLFGLPPGELVARLASLPPDTVVIWGTYYREPGGGAVDPAALLADACTAANAPMFGLFDYDFGKGVVAGRFVDLPRQGDETGKLVARIVGGAQGGDVPPVHVAENPVRADWRALQRWGLDAGLLPPEAEIAFREPGLWERYGRFATAAAAVLAIQTLLIVGLALQRSRRLRAQEALAERLRLERLVADISARFVDLPIDAIDAALADGVREVRATFGADRVTLLQFGPEASGCRTIASASDPDVAPFADVLDDGALGELVGRMRRGVRVQYADAGQNPESMSRLRESLARAGVRSCIIVPLHAAGSAFGALSVESLGEARSWTLDAAARLAILADILANAIVRRQGAADLRRSEALSVAVLGSITAQVCVLDRDGRIAALNDAWRLASGEHGPDVGCHLVGGRCPASAGTPAPCATDASARLHAAVSSVAGGSSPEYSGEYQVSTPIADRWYQLKVEPLRTAGGGAVLSHQDVTSRKRAELEAEQRRTELAHVSRVSTMGELAASIAHELNQPLTGVLANAQAALRFLAADPPNVGEVREILGDIIDDDRRAGEVIRRLRTMLQTGAIEPTAVDLNEVVTGALRLVASDAVLRGVTIDAEFGPGARRIHGDRIQLQQVVLNLIVNAMDAMKGLPAQDRRLTVRTMATDPSTVVVSVSDCGPGIEVDKLGSIFQPFFTTKRDGMGMGLSIARTIVEAHGGVIWAVNNPDQGASFVFRLPVSPAVERPAASVAPG